VNPPFRSFKEIMHSVIQCEINCKFTTTFPCPRVYEFDLKHSIHQSNKMTRQRNCGGEDKKKRRGSTDTETPVGSTWPVCPHDTVKWRVYDASPIRRNHTCRAWRQRHPGLGGRVALGHVVIYGDLRAQQVYSNL